MKDEEFLFYSDVAEKKRVARGAFNRRAHAGKGGAVKLPSDYVKRKDLEKMNGEVKTYSINSPMKWADFKALPDDLKVSYINVIRGRYGASDRKISAMLGVTQTTLSAVCRNLGVGCGEKRPKGRVFDKDAWEKWLHGVRLDKSEEQTQKELPAETGPVQEPTTEAEPKKRRLPPVPLSGSITYSDDAAYILRAAGEILCGYRAKITITWEEVEYLRGDADGRK